MADNILFKSGLASKLNDGIEKIAGQLLFAIDGTSGSIYLDKDSTTRIKMNLDATKLQDARTINGTAFNGTEDIITDIWGTHRDLTIGNSTKSVNGSEAVSWSLSDIGAVAKAGDTMTGILTGKTINNSWIEASRSGAFRTNTAASDGFVSSIISMKTTNGSWGIANLTGNDNLYFAFGTDTNYDANIDTTSNYYITTEGHFSGSAEKANKWSNKMTLKLSGTATTTDPSTVSFDGSEGNNGVSLSMPSQISGFTSIGTSKIIISSTALDEHIAFSRADLNYIKAPIGGSIAFVPNGRDISETGAVLTINDNEVIPGQNNDFINLGTSSYKWKNVYATTFNGDLNGNAATATKAMLDSAEQQINTTYIKGLSASGRTITYTKGDGTTGTITTQDTNTTYSAGTGLSLSGTIFNHSNSITAGTAQGDADKTLTFGGTFTIPTITYDSQGHITSKGTTTMTMPSNPNTSHTHTVGIGLTISGTGGTSGNTTYSANLNSTASLGTIGTTNKLYAVGVDSNGKLCVNVPWTDTNTHAVSSVNGYTGAVTLDYSDVGAAASSHTHSDYLPLAGGTMTGAIITPGDDSAVIRPSRNNYDTIGSSSFYFYKMYSTNYYLGNGTADMSTGTLKIKTIKAPTSSNSSTYGVGSSGQVLKSNGTTVYWGDAADSTYSLPLASSTVRGGVKIGYSSSGKNYAVQLSNEKMYVNVPWTDTNTTYSAGTGLSLSGTTFNISKVPIENGGTNATSASGARNNLKVPLYEKYSGGNLRFGASSTSAWAVYEDDDGNIYNQMDLWTDKTTFKQPVAISSGGTGSTTASGARTNLGIKSGTNPPNYSANPGDIYFQY